MDHDVLHVLGNPVVIFGQAPITSAEPAAGPRVRTRLGASGAGVVPVTAAADKLDDRRIVEAPWSPPGQDLAVSPGSGATRSPRTHTWHGAGWYGAMLKRETTPLSRSRIAGAGLLVIDAPSAGPAVPPRWFGLPPVIGYQA